MRRAFLMLKLSLRNVFRNRYRSLYAVATIAMGAMGLSLFMDFNRGLMNQYRANTIRARWGHGQLFVHGYWAAAHARPEEQWIKEPGPLMERLQRLAGVQQLFPRVTLNAMLVARAQAMAGQGEGVDGVAEARFFNQLNYVEGDDFKEHPRGIVLGQGLAQGLGVKVGDELQIFARTPEGSTRSAVAMVTGIFQTGSHEFDTRAFRVPLALAQNLLASSRIECIAVALTQAHDWSAFARTVDAEFPQLEAIPFDELDKVYYRHAVDWLDAQFAFIRTIILLVVFLAIFNVISVTVIERTPEMATLRANGDSRLEIALSHGLEAAALGIIGGALGLAASWGLTLGPLRQGVAMPPAPGITRSFRILLEPIPGDAWRVVMLCVATTVIGCMLPVWRATRMPIAEALRHS
jgi:putative ABC transport system permease protein